MKILYLLPDFPYPARGGAALRNLGLVLGVAKAGHEVHILSFGAPAYVSANTPLHHACQSVEIIETPDRSAVARVTTLLLSERADMERRAWSAKFLAALDRKLKETVFDIIQFENLEMMVYFHHVHQHQPQAKLIYDAHNAESEIQRLAYENEGRNLPISAYSWIQWKRLTAFERYLYQAVDAIIAVSETDQNAIRSLAGTAPLYLVPNGVDVQEYRTPPKSNVKLEQPALVFTGIMDYRPNIDAIKWFADDILPLIPQAYPKVHLYIVGNRPTPRVTALRQRSNITVTGFVDDILPYFHEAAVVIAPLRIGSGTRLKLLQAMSAGCAIVSTSQGAEGLNVENGRDMLIADDPNLFAIAVNELLQNEVKRLQIGSAAQVFVRTRFDWTVIVPKLLAAYAEITRR